MALKYMDQYNTNPRDNICIGNMKCVHMVWSNTYNGDTGTCTYIIMKYAQYSTIPYDNIKNRNIVLYSVSTGSFNIVLYNLADEVY